MKNTTLTKTLIGLTACLTIHCQNDINSSLEHRLQNTQLTQETSEPTDTTREKTELLPETTDTTRERKELLPETSKTKLSPLDNKLGFEYVHLSNGENYEEVDRFKVEQDVRVQETLFKYYKKEYIAITGKRREKKISGTFSVITDRNRDGIIDFVGIYQQTKQNSLKPTLIIERAGGNNATSGGFIYTGNSTVMDAHFWYNTASNDYTEFKKEHDIDAKIEASPENYKAELSPFNNKVGFEYIHIYDRENHASVYTFKVEKDIAKEGGVQEKLLLYTPEYTATVGPYYRTIKKKMPPSLFVMIDKDRDGILDSAERYVQTPNKSQRCIFKIDSSLTHEGNHKPDYLGFGASWWYNILSETYTEFKKNHDIDAKIKAYQPK